MLLNPINELNGWTGNAFHVNMTTMVGFWRGLRPIHTEVDIYTDTYDKVSIIVRNDINCIQNNFVPADALIKQWQQIRIHTQL